MKKIIVTPENVNEVIALLNENMKGKKYWLALATRELFSIDEYLQMPDFLGAGKFNRIVTTSASLSPKPWLKDYAIYIAYTPIPGSSSNIKFSPYDLGFKPEITILGNDILVYERNNTFISQQGGTSIYLEWNEERVALYNNQFELV